MKPIIKALIIFVLFNTVIYLAMSFYKISFNPVVWGEGPRLVMVLIGLIIGGWLSTYPLFFDKENN